MPDLKTYDADAIFRPTGENSYELVHPIFVMIPNTAYKAPIQKAEPLIYVWTDKDGHQNAGTFDEIPVECRIGK